jgi:hypothetical protein
MPTYAAAAVVYSPVSDDGYYVAVSRRSVAARRAERLEELFWAPADAFDDVPAAMSALERFAPRLGNLVLQTYVLRVKPFLLDEDALIAREIVRWTAPAPAWFVEDGAAA